MKDKDKPPLPQRWAHLRFSVVGPLLASPPPRGELGGAFRGLAERLWVHPATGELTSFGVSTIERWYYTAQRSLDPVAALRKALRSDSGVQRALSPHLQDGLRAQHNAHPSWSYQLHHDNLAVLAEEDESLGPMPCYATVRRFMQAKGLLRKRRLKKNPTPGQLRAALRLEEREVRSYEVEYVNGLWHVDFHIGSLPIINPAGDLMRPELFGTLDDRSRLACHVQWYHIECARTLCHGLGQGFQKRSLPRSLLSDRGGAMLAAETEQGLLDLSVVHDTTLPYSAYQNAKQEYFWTNIEGRLLPMLEGIARELTLEFLNHATQAWCEREYNLKFHSEIGTSPIKRYLEGPDVGRPCPGSDALRFAFTAIETRSQRRSDCTISIKGQRFEVPGRFRDLKRVTVRYADWDLSRVYLIDPQTAKVLGRLYPLDKARNADGRRRRLPAAPGKQSAEPRAPGEIAPLLKKYLAEHAATGLPPAYLPIDEKDTDTEK